MKIHVKILSSIQLTTKLFRQFPYRTIETLVNDKDLMFIGSLILRLVIIVGNNPYTFSSKIKNCEFGKGAIECKEMLCCSNGMCINPLTSLMNGDGRILNTSRCCTENNEIKIFAVLPIKKGDKLTVVECHTLYAFKVESKERYWQEYNSYTFFSHPLARKNWTGILRSPDYLEEYISNDYSPILEVFLRYMIIKDVDRQFGKEDLKIISKAITDLAEKSPQAEISISYVCIDWVFRNVDHECLWDETVLE